MMRGFVLFACAWLCTGCALLETGAPPRENPWEALESSSSEAEIARPLPLPEFPRMERSGDGVALIDAEGRVLGSGSARLAAWMLELRTAAEANSAIAENHAAGLEARRAAEEQLIAAGKAEHELAELRAAELRSERLWGRIQLLAVTVLAALGIVAL